MFAYNPENRVVRALETCFNVVWLTILALVCSMPVLTAGASLTAYTASLMAVCEERGSGVTADFFRRFTSGMREATMALLAVLAVGVVLVLDIRACAEITAPEGILWLFRSSTAAFTLLFLCILEWLFAGLGRFEAPLWQTFKNAVCWAGIHWKTTLLLLLLDALAAALTLVLWWFALLPAAFLQYQKAKAISRIFFKYVQEGS